MCKGSIERGHQGDIENGPVEIVDLSINSMVMFHNYVGLPEGTMKWFIYWLHWYCYKYV
jgi:hypothetical protein